MLNHQKLTSAAFFLTAIILAYPSHAQEAPPVRHLVAPTSWHFYSTDHLLLTTAQVKAADQRIIDLTQSGPDLSVLPSLKSPLQSPADLTTSSGTSTTR